MIPLISIIIPVYNSEKYFEKCLDSVLAQTFTDFEVLVINDGSTDSSGKICDDYAQKDSRIKVFHKENGGVSSARNLGIENAKGEWICFVDSDDEIAGDFLDFFSLNDNSLDLHIQGICKKYDNRELLLDFKNQVYEVSSFLAEYHFGDYFFGPTSKLYRKEILKKNEINFDVTSSYGEDAIFNLNYFFFTKRIRTYENIGYYYCLAEDSGGLSKVKENFAIDFKLLSDLKTNFMVLDKKFTLQKDYKYHLQYLIGRTLSSIYKSSKDNKQMLSNFKLFFKHFKDELLFIYRKPKGKKKIYYYLIKKEQIHILHFINKYYFFK